MLNLWGLLRLWPFWAFHYVGGLLRLWPFEGVAFWGGGLLGHFTMLVAFWGCGLLRWWPFEVVAFWGGGLLGHFTMLVAFWGSGLLRLWPFEVVAFWGCGLLGSGLLRWWPFELWPFGVDPAAGCPLGVGTGAQEYIGGAEVDRVWEVKKVALKPGFRFFPLSTTVPLYNKQNSLDISYNFFFYNFIHTKKKK